MLLITSVLFHALKKSLIMRYMSRHAATPAFLPAERLNAVCLFVDVLQEFVCLFVRSSPYGQLCNAVMVDVQHLQFAALAHPLGDTSQLVPLRKQIESAAG